MKCENYQKFTLRTFKWIQFHRNSIRFYCSISHVKWNIVLLFSNFYLSILLAQFRSFVLFLFLSASHFFFLSRSNFLYISFFLGAKLLYNPLCMSVRMSVTLVGKYQLYKKMSFTKVSHFIKIFVKIFFCSFSVSVSPNLQHVKTVLIFNFSKKFLLQKFLSSSNKEYFVK